MRHTFFLVGLAALLLVISERATAQSQDPPEIESRFELNTFQPANNPYDGFVLDHAAVLKSLQFGAQITVQVDDDPLTWQREKEDGSYAETAVAVRRLIVLHVGAAIGFFDYGQLSVHFPTYLDRGTANTNGGVGDLTFVPKGAYRFEAGKADIGVAALMPLSVPTGDNKRLMGEGGVSIAPGIAADLKLGKLRIVLNAAYYWRKKEDKNLVRGEEMLLGLGGELDILTNPGILKALVEVNMATQTADFFGRASTPAEILAGVKYRFVNGVGLFGALGPGISPGVGAPDLRFALGIDYVSQKAAKEDLEGGSGGLDTDSDGILDTEDSCPNESEDFDKFEDDDGCPEPDNDQDGVLDGDDQCPMESENINGLEDKDGCPETDEDMDMISDLRDACPDEPEDLDGYMDKDGCPDEDNDLDGFPDVDDQCPILPETINGYKDKDGCPDYFELKDNNITFKRRIRFIKKTADLHKSAFDIFDELASTIISNPYWIEVQIIVHTNGRGNADAQQRLSEKRAATILRLLVASGIIPERLIATGRGNSEPLASPDEREGRMQNQRVEIKIGKGAAQ